MRCAGMGPSSQCLDGGEGAGESGLHAVRPQQARPVLQVLRLQAARLLHLEYYVRHGQSHRPSDYGGSDGGGGGDGGGLGFFVWNIMFVMVSLTARLVMVVVVVVVMEVVMG